MPVFTIPAGNLPELEARLRRLARRAARLGLRAPTYATTGTERITAVDPRSGAERVTLVRTIDVDPGCGAVRLAGWTFQATIQHTEEGNILRARAGADIPVRFRDCDAACDHCRTQRNRRDTYIVRHDDGTVRQIGRSCLRDFLGSDDALTLAEQAEYAADVDAMGDGLGEASGSGGPAYEALEVYLAHVAETIRIDGWLSRAAARDVGRMATADVAMMHMPGSTARGFTRLYSAPSDESVAEANAAVAWASAIEGEEISDYLHNVRTIARRMVCEPRDLGIAASIVSAYQRHMSTLRYKDLQTKRRAESRHIGTVGESVRVTVTVEKVIQCESQYGVTHLHIMTDADGNALVWFASSAPLATGKTLLLQGTVKAHGERNGVQQTTLTRCAEITLRTFVATVGAQSFTFTALDETEVKTMLRATLGAKRLPKGVSIVAT